MSGGVVRRSSQEHLTPIEEAETVLFPPLAIQAELCILMTDENCPYNITESKGETAMAMMERPQVREITGGKCWEHEFGTFFLKAYVPDNDLD